jgi:predicted  nucleic acid-binding Zn-ribbon protein
MTISIQTNSPISVSSNSSSDASSQVAKISRQIQVLTAKLGKIASEEGMTPQQKKEKAALIQKQIESLRAELEQLLRKQAEKKDKDTPAQTDKKEDKNTLNTIDIHV